MSAVCSVQEVLNDAKKLTNRLKKYDTATDGLLSKAKNLEKSVESMREYHSEMENLSKVYSHLPRSSLIVTIQKESKQLQDLERENRDLRIALEDHQNALELIMSKYRVQMSQLIKSNEKNQQLMSSLTQNQYLCPSCLNLKYTNHHHGYHHPQELSPLNHSSSSDGSSFGSPNAPRKMVMRTAGVSDSNASSDLIKQQSEKITEMATVMRRAAELDEINDNKQQELISKLRIENSGLRELLMISRNTGSSICQSNYCFNPKIDNDEEKPNVSKSEIGVQTSVVETDLDQPLD